MTAIFVVCAVSTATITKDIPVFFHLLLETQSDQFSENSTTFNERFNTFSGSQHDNVLIIKQNIHTLIKEELNERFQAQRPKCHVLNLLKPHDYFTYHQV